VATFVLSSKATRTDVATEMVISIRKVDPVKGCRQPDAAIGSHQTTPTQPTDDQEYGPELNIPLPSVAKSVEPSPVVAESPVLGELKNTSHVVPLVPVGAVHQVPLGHQVIYGAPAPVGAVHQVPLGHQVMYGAPAPMAVPFKPAASYLGLPPAQATMLRTETARSGTSFSAVTESPKLATTAFDSTSLPCALSDRAQHAAMSPSSSFASASGGACPDAGSGGGGGGGGGGPWIQTPSISVDGLLPPMDFIFYKDPNPLVPLAPAEPVPDLRNTRELSVKTDTSHVQSLKHLSSQLQDLMGSQMKLNTELWELKQQLCSNCQDPEGIRREPQNRFVAPSLRYSSAPRLSLLPVLSMRTKNLGYDRNEDMLANVRGHAARGLETLHRHTAKAVQHFSDSSWLASIGRLPSRSC